MPHVCAPSIDILGEGGGGTHECRVMQEDLGRILVEPGMNPIECDTVLDKVQVRSSDFFGKTAAHGCHDAALCRAAIIPRSRLI